MSGLETVREGLQRFLGDRWGEVEVPKLRRVSGGARRLNVLFDAERGAETLELAATVLQTSAIQIVPIDVEAATLRLAEEAGVPVPHVQEVCLDESYVGGPFFVASRVPGVSVGRQVLRLAADDADLGPLIGRQCGEAMARLHAVDITAAHPDLPRPRGGAPAAASIADLRQKLDALLQPSPSFALAVRWLEDRMPAEDGRLHVVHGDMRNGNILVSERGLEAILDWEGAHLGDGMADLAWLCQRMWRFRNDHLEVGGIAERAHLRQGYEAAGGSWNEDSFQWWKVHETLRWGLGLAGQAMQHLDRSFRSVIMAGSGRRIAEIEFDLLMLMSPSYRRP
jgi:aminoglycoside phosphotransferase (APT) family kinase protein